VYSISEVLNLFGKSIAICVNHLVEFEDTAMMVKLPLFDMLAAAQSSELSSPKALGDYQIEGFSIHITIRANILKLFA